MKLPALAPILVSLLALPGIGVTTVQAQTNASIDPDHMYISEAPGSGYPVVTEPVLGSDIPNEIHMVELRDGLYAPVGIRRPPGLGKFPVVVIAHMNGGLGLRWLREWARNGSWTMERLLDAGYAVALMRYRAEVETSYETALVEGSWQGRQIFSRSPFEYEDVIAIIEYLKGLDFIDGERIGYLGVSHGGEMLMKIATEYDGIRAGVASEPASMGYLARGPDPMASNDPEPETYDQVTPEMYQKAIDKTRARLDLDKALKRISSIDTPILIIGRDRDHNQAVFRLNYELLIEAGKIAAWKSYDHDNHGYIFVKRGTDDIYRPDDLQRQAVNDAIEWFDRQLLPAE
jgi:dienelactone hydrolase